MDENDMVDLSEEQPQVGVTIPLFIKKLWNMVNDEDARNIISWNSAGDGFIIHDQFQFITELLPHYFKHNNMASFVRQLNFYNFHKVPNVRDEIQFAHSCFLKDVPQVLVFIRRKHPALKQKSTTNITEDEVRDLLNDVKQMKIKHSRIDKEMLLLKQENAALWSELNSLRMKYAKQSSIINKLIHFLITYIHTHQTSFSKQNIQVSRDINRKNLKSRPTLLELDYKNHKDTKSSPYSVLQPGTSGRITYSVKLPESHLKNDGKTHLSSELASAKKSNQSLKQILALNDPRHEVVKNSQSGNITHSVKLPGNQSAKITQPDVRNTLLEILEENEKLSVDKSLEEMLREMQTEDIELVTDNNEDSHISINQPVIQSPQADEYSVSPDNKFFSSPNTDSAKFSVQNHTNYGNITSAVTGQGIVKNIKSQTLSNVSKSGNKIKSTGQFSRNENVFKNISRQKKNIHSDTLDHSLSKKPKKLGDKNVTSSYVQFPETQQTAQPQVQNSLLEILQENEKLSSEVPLEMMLSEIQSDGDNLVGFNAQGSSDLPRTLNINPPKSVQEKQEETPSNQVVNYQYRVDIPQALEPNNMNDQEFNIIEIPETDIVELPDMEIEPIVEIPLDDEKLSPNPDTLKDSTTISILENPKQNLSAYLDNTQDELNILQDILSNLNSKEFGDILGSADFDLNQNFDRDLSSISTASEEKNTDGSNIVANELGEDNAVGNVATPTPNIISVDEFFNTDFMDSNDVQ